MTTMPEMTVEERAREIAEEMIGRLIVLKHRISASLAVAIKDELSRAIPVIQREAREEMRERDAEIVHGNVWLCPCCGAEYLPHADGCTYATDAPEEEARWRKWLEAEATIRALLVEGE